LDSMLESVTTMATATAYPILAAMRMVHCTIAADQ
jgi:hypothetical protein